MKNDSEYILRPRWLPLNNITANICVFKFKTEATPSLQEISPVDVSGVINQYHHCAFCLSLTDSETDSLLQTRACDSVCHCTSQSMDNTSVSLYEEHCQIFQWEMDQTDEQFTVLLNLLTHQVGYPSSFPYFLLDSTLSDHFVLCTSLFNAAFSADTESSCCDSLYTQPGQVGVEQFKHFWLTEHVVWHNWKMYLSLFHLHNGFILIYNQM